MQDTFCSIEKKVSAIIICNPPDAVSGKTALLYRYVDNTEAGLPTFIKFAKKFPNAKYINFYSRSTRQYLGRKYLNI